MNTAALKTTWNTSMQVASGLGFGLALKVLQCDPQEEYTKLKNLIDPYYQVLRNHEKVEDHRNLIGRVASIFNKDTDGLIKKIKWEIRWFNDDDLKTFEKIYNCYLIYIRVLQAGFRTLPAWDTSVRVCRLIEQAGCQIPYSSFLIAGTCITSFGLTFFCTQENLKPWQKKTARWIRSHSYTLHFTVRVIYSIALIQFGHRVVGASSLAILTFSILEDKNILPQSICSIIRKSCFTLMVARIFSLGSHSDRFWTIADISIQVLL